MTQNIFETASRLNLTFDTNKGQVNVNDLWNLPLTSATGKANLDDIARELHKKLKDEDTVSFVNKSVASDNTVQLKFDIVKHIIETRLAENQAASVARDNAEKKQRILQIIAEREDETLKGASIDDLRAMLAAM